MHQCVSCCWESKFLLQDALKCPPKIMALIFYRLLRKHRWQINTYLSLNSYCKWLKSRDSTGSCMSCSKNYTQTKFLSTSHSSFYEKLHGKSTWAEMEVPGWPKYTFTEDRQKGVWMEPAWLNELSGLSGCSYFLWVELSGKPKGSGMGVEAWNKTREI